MSPLKTFSFPRQARLLTREEFQKVFDSAHKSRRLQITYAGSAYLLYSSKPKSESRLGISIPSKVVRRAHERNRIKRVIREFFRLNRDLFREDMVIRVTQCPEDFSYEALVCNLRSTLRQRSEGN